jgi:tetratricopeptide (TPR) repeat protein
MRASFLSHFTPSMMSSEALEAIFVQREGLAQRLIELISDSVLTKSKHHTLLIGPRGIGKTHLVSLLYHRIRKMSDLQDRIFIAWLREEERGVASFLDLLLRIFRALLAEDSKAEFAAKVESLYSLSHKTAERAAENLLKDLVGNRTLLIVVENLDELFKGLGEKGQKRFRAYLQENPFCTILATAQSLFNEVSLKTSPFYGFFRIHHLEKLSLDEATSLLAQIARYEGNSELASFIPTPMGRARIRAVHHLAGGNHRLYIIFSQFLTRDSLNDLVEPFMHTLDDLTPYYQARLSFLSSQQQKIVEYLCERRHAVPVKEIAQRCFMTHQTASSQLKDLREKGYVYSKSAGRESYYELYEPLMRLCIEVKMNRGEPIQLFLDFLRLWYSPADLQHLLTTLPSEADFEREYIVHALQITGRERVNPTLKACLEDYSTYFKGGDFAGALQAAEELVAVRGQGQDWLNQGNCLRKLGRYEDALVSYTKVIEIEPNNARTWSNRGTALVNLKRHEEALAAFDKALEIEPNNAWAWSNRGTALVDLKRHEEALASLDKALEIEPNNAWAWSNRGAALGSLERYEEVLAAFDKVIEIEPNNARAWFSRGAALGNLKRHEEALASFDKVIEIEPNNAMAWFNRGIVLSNLGPYEKALVSCDKALEFGYQDSLVFFLRAECLLALNRWDEGCRVLDDALNQFAHSEEPITGDTGAIVCNLFNSTRDAATWEKGIQRLIALYEKHNSLSALGQGLVRSISLFDSPMINNKTAQVWTELWMGFVDNRPEFQIPLRLLDTVVRYRESDQDIRVLLQLPIEERMLLKQILKEDLPEI